MSEANTTVDHDEIRSWAESRGGRPSVVRTGRGKGGVLRFDFGDKEETFDEISWDEFFEIFEQSKLAFLHQNKTADGGESRFNKFVKRTSGGRSSGPAAPAKKAAGRAAGAKEGGARSASKSTTGAKGRGAKAAEGAGAGKAKSPSRGAAAKASTSKSASGRGSGAKEAAGRGSSAKTGGAKSAADRESVAKPKAARASSAKSGGSRTAGAAKKPTSRAAKPKS